MTTRLRKNVRCVYGDSMLGSVVWRRHRTRMGLAKCTTTAANPPVPQLHTPLSFARMLCRRPLSSLPCENHNAVARGYVSESPRHGKNRGEIVVRNPRADAREPPKSFFFDAIFGRPIRSGAGV